MKHALFPLAALALALPTAAQNVGLNLTNGIDAYLDAPYDPSIVPRSGITVEAWITYDDATLGAGYRWPTVVRQNPAAGSEVYMLRVDAGNVNNRNLKWAVLTANGRFQIIWPFAPGQFIPWTHLAASYDGAALRLFVNGVEVASTPANGGAIANTGNALRIGNGDLSAPGAEEWNGQIDEVRLWPFARTAAEIQSTMNFELALVPGEVSTWNLNGTGIDSSWNNSAAPVNAPTFAQNTLVLTQLGSYGATTFGTATPGCLGTPRMVMGTFGKVGNAAFSLGTIRATATGSGVLWFGTRNLTSPINVLGIDLWLDPGQPNVLVSIPGGPLGYVRVPMPIPNLRYLASQSFYAQTIWAQAGCAVPIFSSTPLTFSIAL